MFEIEERLLMPHRVFKYTGKTSTQFCQEKSQLCSQGVPGAFFHKDVIEEHRVWNWIWKSLLDYSILRRQGN